MSEIVPALTIVVGVSLVWLIASALWSIFVPERRLWPPRVRQGFLYHFNAVLSPGINFGLFGLSLLSWNSGPFEHWARALWSESCSSGPVSVWRCAASTSTLGLEATNSNWQATASGGETRRGSTVVGVGRRV